MSNRGLHYLLVFVSFIVAIGIACGSTNTVPTATAPTAAPAPTIAVPTDVPPTGASDTTGSTGGLTTFTDQSKYFKIDVPSDWKHTSATGDHDYADTFTSPDGHAVIDSYVYDDGTSWSGKDSGKAALLLLNKYYSKTGQEGDIRVSEEKQQPDGSDRLTWTSKSGKYSGISFFEVRNSTSFLMFSVYWDDGFKDQYSTALDNVIASYATP